MRWDEYFRKRSIVFSPTQNNASARCPFSFCLPTLLAYFLGHHPLRLLLRLDPYVFGEEDWGKRDGNKSR